MNCSTPATSFFRACRARPVSVPNLNLNVLLVAQRSKNASTTATPTALATRSRRPFVAPFSTKRSLRQAQSATSSSSSSSSPSSSLPPSSASFSTSSTSHLSPSEEDTTFLSTTPTFTGHVTRVGTMQHTVRVTRTIQVWHSHFQKHYKRPHHELVHDPQNILLEGDVVTFTAFPPSVLARRAERIAGEQQGSEAAEGKHVPRARVAQDEKRPGVKFVLKEVITPFGVPVEMRTPRVVGSPEGRWKGTAGEVRKVVRQARGARKARIAAAAAAAAEAAA